MSDPIVGENGNEEKKPIAFDPETGAPIYSEDKKVKGYDPETGEPIFESEGSNKFLDKLLKNWKIITAVLAGIIAVVVIVGIIVGGSPKAKIGKALVKTFQKNSELVTTYIDLAKIVSGDFTMDVDFNYDDGYDVYKGEVSVASASKRKQISCDLDLEDIPTINGIIDVDSSKLSVSLDSFFDGVFVYNYKKDVDGVLEDYLSEDDIEQINALLESISGASIKDAGSKEAVDKFKKVGNELEFKKIKNRKFKVDGKKVSCKGYAMIITEDFCDELLDVFEETLREQLSATEDIDSMVGGDIEYYVSNYMDEMKYVLSMAQDAEINFYINKGMLAAITAEADDEEFVLAFEGGDYRTQNIVMYDEDDDEFFALKGKKKGTKETIAIEIDGDEEFSLSYDSKNGKFEIEVDGETVEGKLLSKGNKWEFSMEFDDGYDALEISVTFEKGADFKKLSGDEINLNELDEDDLEDLAQEIYGALYSFY